MAYIVASLAAVPLWSANRKRLSSWQSRKQKKAPEFLGSGASMWILGRFLCQYRNFEHLRCESNLNDFEQPCRFP